MSPLAEANELIRPRALGKHIRHARVGRHMPPSKVPVPVGVSRPI